MAESVMLERAKERRMQIVEVKQRNTTGADRIHAESWKKSHRSFWERAGVDTGFRLCYAPDRSSITESGKRMYR